MLVCNSLESGPRQQLACKTIHSFKEPREPQPGPLICESMEVGVSAKGVTEKEHMDETHYSRPSRNRRVFRLHSLQAFASEMKGRWSHRRSFSIYQRHRLSAGDTFDSVGSLGT